MAARPRRLSPGPATTFSAILVMVAVAGGLLAQGAVRHQERAAQRSRAEADVARFESGLRLVATTAGEAAAAAASGAPSFRITASRAVDARAARAVALADGDGRIRSVTARTTIVPLTEGGHLFAVAGVPAAAEAAAATDHPRLALVSLAVGPTIVAVAPVHATAATSVADRRAATSGVVAVAVPVDELRHPFARPELWPGAPVRVTAPAFTSGPAVPHPLVARPVQAGGVVWRVAVGAAPTGRPLTGWLTLAAGLLVAAAVHVALRRQHDQRRQAEGLSGTRARQLEMIAATSAALQQSLDLADLLPAFCVNVTEEFGLSGTSILVADDDGHLVEAFRFSADGRRDRAADELVTELELR
ncbi:MAG: hypothetical protein JWO68_442, partial [Actinomycetia bacterium]|nr:hypothetical protein [Actinomycetes bacterium]